MLKTFGNILSEIFEQSDYWHKAANRPLVSQETKYLTETICIRLCLKEFKDIRVFKYPPDRADERLTLYAIEEDDYRERFLQVPMRNLFKDEVSCLKMCNIFIVAFFVAFKFWEIKALKMTDIRTFCGLDEGEHPELTVDFALECEQLILKMYICIKKRLDWKLYCPIPEK